MHALALASPTPARYHAGMGAKRRDRKREQAIRSHTADATGPTNHHADHVQADNPKPCLQSSLALRPTGAGAVGDRGRAYRDMRLVARAIRSDWPIEPEQRKAVMQRLLALVADAPAGLACKAAATLVAADNVNAKREAGDVAARGQDVAAQRDLLDALARDHPELLQQLLDATLPMPQSSEPQALPPPADRNGKPA
jgi:hypothetical protein